MSPELSQGQEQDGAANDAESFMTQAELAELYRVSERTVERWRVEGTGPPFTKFGRRVAYRRDLALEYAESRTFRSTAEAEAA